MNTGINYRISYQEDAAAYRNWKSNCEKSGILLCDEPTGALDYHTSKEILQLIEDVNKKYGNTVVMVTHNGEIEHMADRVVNFVME